MRKFAIAFAALAAFGIAIPLISSAKAQDAVVIKKGDHDRDMHRHHKKIVVIKHRRHHHHD
jgi:hypothetical protein